MERDYIGHIYQVRYGVLRHQGLHIVNIQCKDKDPRAYPDIKLMITVIVVQGIIVQEKNRLLAYETTPIFHEGKIHGFEL